MSDDQLRLDRQLCFALYAASRAFTSAYRPLLEDLGLTYPQYLVMLVLWDRDGRGVKEVADELELDTGTVSPLVRRLEVLGLVERRRRDPDERRVSVHLTPAGRALRADAEGVPECIAGMTGLDAETATSLHRTLAALTTSLKNSAGTTPRSEARSLK